VRPLPVRERRLCTHYVRLQHKISHYEIEYRNLKKEEAADRIQPPYQVPKYLLKTAIRRQPGIGWGATL
jgi:hypothetical protein